METLPNYRGGPALCSHLLPVPWTPQRAYTVARLMRKDSARGGSPLPRPAQVHRSVSPRATSTPHSLVMGTATGHGPKTMTRNGEWTDKPALVLERWGLLQGFGWGFGGQGEGHPREAQRRLRRLCTPVALTTRVLIGHHSRGLPGREERMSEDSRAL